MLEAALEYARRGWRVLPIKTNGKTPLNDNGSTGASVDEATIRAWWEKCPTANVGIAAGDGLVVLDVDPRHGGDLALDALRPLPDTPCVKTGGGGLHYYFTGTARNSASKLGAGLDVRGDGGYVVAPPSVHESGNTYEWLDSDVDLAPWPEAWNAAEKRAGAAPVPNKIAPGQRNATLASIAGTMRRRGIGWAEILAALRAVNAERCSPPLSDEELTQVAQSVARYEPELKQAAADDPRNALRAALMEIHEGKSSPLVKAKAAGDLVFAHLSTLGRFYVDRELSYSIGATDRTLHFFDNRTRDLICFDSPEFNAMLYEDTWVSERDQLFAKIKSHLHLVAVRSAERVDIHDMSYYDESTKTLYIHHGENRVYVLDGGEIREENNGVGGVLFRHDSRGDSWDADFDFSGSPLLEMFKEVKIDATGVTAQQLQILLAVFCVLVGFANVQRTKLIVTLVGEQGSGKSFLARRMGRLWSGPRWQVSSCEPERENDAVLSLTTDRITCFDNLDTRVTWVQDKLALAATGAQVQRRALYTDSKMLRTDIVSFIIVTTRDPRWIKREDVVQRMLPIHMTKRVESFLAENVLEARESAARPARMGHLLTIANDVVRQLRDGAMAQPTRLRIADFAFMGQLAANALGEGEAFSTAVETLPSEQREFLTEDHPVLEALDEWLTQSANEGRPVDAIVLYREMAEFSGWSERSGVRNVRQLQHRLKDFEDEIKSHIGPFTSGRHPQTGRQSYTFYRKSDEPEPAVKGQMEVPF